MSEWLGMEAHITSDIDMRGRIKWLHPESIHMLSLLLEGHEGLGAKVLDAVAEDTNIPQGSNGPVDVRFEDDEETLLQHVRMAGTLRDRTELSIPSFLDQIGKLLLDMEGLGATITATVFFYSTTNWHHSDTHLYIWEASEWKGGKAPNRNTRISVGEDLSLLHRIINCLYIDDVESASALVSTWYDGLSALKDYYPERRENANDNQPQIRS